MYPALLPLMRTPRLPVVDWTDAPADLNGLVRFAERRNLVSAREPSHFKRSLHSFVHHGSCQVSATSDGRNVHTSVAIQHTWLPKHVQYTLHHAPILHSNMGKRNWWLSKQTSHDGSNIQSQLGNFTHLDINMATLWIKRTWSRFCVLRMVKSVEFIE